MDSSKDFHIKELDLKGVLLISPNVYKDLRGYSANPYDKSYFSSIGLPESFVQDYSSFSVKNVIRGLHYQVPPHQQEKLIRCSFGAILDVVADINPESETFKQHIFVSLDSRSAQSLFVPQGYAHGYAVLSDFAVVEYKFGSKYMQESSRGIRYDDPELNISWPIQNPLLSDQDSSWERFSV